MVRVGRVVQNFRADATRPDPPGGSAGVPAAARLAGRSCGFGTIARGGGESGEAYDADALARIPAVLRAVPPPSTTPSRIPVGVNAAVPSAP